MRGVGERLADAGAPRDLVDQVTADLAVLAAAAATGADATFVGPATLGDVAVAALLRG